MSFWDASAVLPLLIDEESTDGTQTLIRRDPSMTVWWATEVECAAAIARRERSGGLREQAATEAFRRLERNAAGWNEVDPVPSVRRTARRLLRVHPLRTADAMQLAAAIVSSEGDPSTQGFVCLDDRLIDVARREGLTVIDPRAD